MHGIPFCVWDIVWVTMAECFQQTTPRKGIQSKKGKHALQWLFDGIAVTSWLSLLYVDNNWFFRLVQRHTNGLRILKMFFLNTTKAVQKATTSFVAVNLPSVYFWSAHWFCWTGEVGGNRLFSSCWFPYSLEVALYSPPRISVQPASMAVFMNVHQRSSRQEHQKQKQLQTTNLGSFLSMIKFVKRRLWSMFMSFPPVYISLAKLPLVWICHTVFCFHLHLAVFCNAYIQDS